MGPGTSWYHRCSSWFANLDMSTSLLHAALWMLVGKYPWFRKLGSDSSGNGRSHGMLVLPTPLLTTH